MGMIYHDIYTTSHGLEKKGVYLSFSCEPITLSQQCLDDPYGPYRPNRPAFIPTSLLEEREYHVSAYYRVWWNQDAHDMGKPYVDRIKLTVILNHPNVSPYTALYEELKKTYPNYSDVWEEQRC